MKKIFVLAALFCFALETSAAVNGWLNWRGPQQNGSSLEKNLPDKIDAAKPLWVADFPGQSTAVVANGKVYIVGYLGEGADLRKASRASTRTPAKNFGSSFTMISSATRFICATPRRVRRLILKREMFICKARREFSLASLPTANRFGFTR